MKNTIALLLTSLILLSGCETGPGSLSQPANSSEVSAARAIGSPIAFSGIYAERNVVDALDVSVTWKNISPKEIKYVFLEIGLKNRVEDWVRGEITRRESVTLKYTGPFKPNKNHWGGLGGHPAAIYNREATSVVIKSVYVEYMDGTKSAVIDTARLASTVGSIGSKRY